MTTEADLVLFERRNGVGLLTLNRPAKRNALSHAMLRQFRDVLSESRDCQALVVSANGPAFCAGVDLPEQRELRAAGGRVYAHGSHQWVRTLLQLREHPAVFVAAVGGPALGGGLTLVNACELAVASPAASFGMPEVSLGAFPAQAGPSTMRRILPKHAAWMILTAERLNADEALRAGLVNEVVPAEQLQGRALEIAARIATYGAEVLDFTKKAIRDVEGMTFDEGIVHGNYVNAMIRDSVQRARP
jgi:enoyl-CoA hydratase/carnithine racemase